MDEIIDRVKSVKIRRKNLIFPLIFAEIIGILTLIWFLRIPLAQKYLTSPPDNYSVNSMDPGIQYLLRQGDFINGRTKPNSTLQIRLAGDGAKNGVISDTEGNFTFQIPLNTNPGPYQLIIAGDNSDETTVIRILKIRVQSNNILSQFLEKFSR